MFRADGIDCILRNDCLSLLVPKKFHHVSGIKTHSFAICQVPSGPSRYIKQPEGRWIEFEPFVACTVRREGRDHLILVSSEVSEHVFDAIRLLGSIDSETQRERRYITVHQAYEAVVQNLSIDLSAIRHTLTHPPNLLTHRATIQSLRSRFGGTIINLHDYRHRKQFFISLGKMLIETDRALFNLIDSHWSQWGKLDASTTRSVKQLQLPFCDIKHDRVRSISASTANIDLPYDSRTLGAR